MAYVPTIIKEDLLHCDLLYYRPKTLFGRAIGLFEAIVNRKFDRMTFSHVAIMLYDETIDADNIKHSFLKRFDAMEGYKTGFREEIEQAYMFRLDMLTPEQIEKIQKYAMARKGSKYDRKGILSFIIRFFIEDEFDDYCSEFIKNCLVTAGIMDDCEKIRPFELYKLLRPQMHFHGIII